MARKYDSEETKQKILSSSVRLFIEKGYHETTMTEILQRWRSCRTYRIHV